MLTSALSLLLLAIIDLFFKLFSLLFLALHLLDQEVLLQELCEHLFRELAPKLRHEVPRRQVLRRLQILVNFGQRRNT